MGIIQKQGIQNTIITYSGIAIGFVSLLYIQPRFLTKEEIGLVRVLFSFSAMIATVFPLGTGSITYRYFPFFKDHQKGHHGYFGFMMIWPLIGYAICALALLAFRSFIINQYEVQSRLFTVYFNHVYSFIFIIGFVAIVNSYSFALFKTFFPSIVNEIVLRIAYIAVILIYAAGWVDLDGFLYLFIGTYLLQLIIVLVYILIVDKPGLKINFDFLKTQNPMKMLSYGLVLSFSGMANLGLKYIDVIILGKYVSLSKVGVYALAAFIPTVIDAPYYALDKITNPKIGEAWAKKDMGVIQEIYFKSTRYLMLLGGLIFLGINLNIDQLFTLIPNNYSEGINVVFIISLGTLINISTGVNDAIIFTSSKYIYGTYMLLSLLILAVVNNFIFIPKYGIEGAAMATALSAFVYNLMKYLYIWKKFNLQPFGYSSLKIIIIIIITWLTFHWFPVIPNAVTGIVFKSVLITVFYTGLAYWLGIVPEFHKFLPWNSDRTS
ncbi:MAG: oligosaccharide flippase family protein [Bacteroidota bacterium]